MIDINIAEKQIVDKYLGIPYVEGGRTLEGLNCWGVVVQIYNDFGIKVFDLEEKDPEWGNKGAQYFAEFYYKDWEKQTAPGFLDVIFIMNYDGSPFHAGIYLRDGRFIHGSKIGVVQGRLNSRLMKKLHGFYKHKEFNII